MIDYRTANFTDVRLAALAALFVLLTEDERDALVLKAMDAATALRMEHTDAAFVAEGSVVDEFDAAYLAKLDADAEAALALEMALRTCRGDYDQPKPRWFEEGWDDDVDLMEEVAA